MRKGTTNLPQHGDPLDPASKRPGISHKPYRGILFHYGNTSEASFFSS